MKRLIALFFVLACVAAYPATIADQLTTLSDIKGEIKTAIEAKGQTVTASFSSYAPAIASITSPFMWGGSTDWTLASTTATSTFYQDFSALASVVTDVNGTNEDDYNSSVISEYDTFFNDAGLSRLPGSYSRTIHVPPANSIGTCTTVSIRNGYRSGSVVLPNGKILVIPRTYYTLDSFDPFTNGFSIGPAAFWGDYALSTGILMGNGKVVLLGLDYNGVVLYDYIKKTAVAGPSISGSASIDRLWSGLLLQNGTVFCCPAREDNIGIYNPENNTYTLGPIAETVDPAFKGCVHMDNGKICMVPFSSDYVGLYDPDTNTYTRGPLAETGGAQFHGGCRSLQGKIIFSPWNCGYVGIYDPIANTYTRGCSAESGYESYAGAVLSPSSDIIFPPYRKRNIGIYHSNSNTFTVGAADSSGHLGGVLGPTGSIYMNSWSDWGFISIYNNGYPPVPIDACLHPLINKN